MIGETFSHYRICAELGRGGMGVVYRAEDLRLKRPVALKFLPDERCCDRQAVARFQREAQAASALNHPHICTIYDIDEHEGRHFIAMELLEGQTLGQRMRERHLDADEILTWAIQIADALLAAHAERIIHRDIKPANIFVTRRGDAKILDFGLAKLLGESVPGHETSDETTRSAAATDRNSRPGTVAGTVAYMSPEQARGNDLDARSDLFSLGVVLYEMSTGQLPFRGNALAALFDEILHKEPEPPHLLNPALPVDLGRIVGKALQKDRALRYQTASDLQADLRLVSRSQAAPRTSVPAAVDPSGIRSVAVLPFTDMSPEQDQQHFCDGIAEELTTSLARLRELRVPARTSSFSFKGKNTDVREIGRTLNVGAVLQGSVRKAGGRLRITAQLVNAADGYHLWTERYDREAKDIFAIQDEVTAAIIEHLKLTLVPEEREGVFRRRTNNLAAHGLYLQGLRYLWNEAGQGFDSAIQCFERALAEDPNYAQAYWGLSDAYLQVAFWGNVPPTEAARKVKQYARQALALDPALGEAHGALSYVHLIHDWNWEMAGREALEAIRLTPNSSMVHAYYSWFLLNTGRVQEGVAEALKAQSLDPVSSFISFAVGLAFTVTGDLRRAVDAFEAGLRINPDFAILHEVVGRILSGQQRYEDARIAHDRAVTISRRLPYFVAGLAISHEQLGHKAEAEALWRELRERATREYVAPLCFLQIHGLRGELRALVRTLRQAADVRDSRLCWMRVMPPEYFQAPGESRLKARLNRAVIRAAINWTIARRRIEDPPS